MYRLYSGQIPLSEYMIVSMENYNSEQEYIEELERRGRLPEGFKTAVVSLSFKPEERPVDKPLPMNLSMLSLDKATTVFAAVFTRNKFPGAPVLVGRKMLDNSRIRGVVVNNKIANVCTSTGVEDALRVTNAVASAADAAAAEYFPSSTGIIGWKIPVKEMSEKAPELVSSLRGGSALPFAKGIMTTDSFPKLRSADVSGGRIVAVAKGAGMIEPNMATMLSYIMTDIIIDRDELRAILKRTVDKTYNCISVDSDQSTSDTVIAMSSCLKGGVSSEEFEAALLKVCSDLSEDIIRNSEGSGHVIKVKITGAEDYYTAREIGKAVINSSLVTTAVFGNDPNVGRILSSVGDYMGNNNLELDKDEMTIKLGPETVFNDGAFTLDEEKEIRLSDYLKERTLDSEHKTYPEHDKTVDIEICLSRKGKGSAQVIGSDLSYGYVKENADYRS